METPEARAWREAYQAGMQPGSDACPGDEELVALVLGELRPDQRVTLARHVTECRRCTEGYRTLRTLHAETRRRLPRRRRVRWAAASAAAVLVAGLGLTLVWLGRSGGPVAVDDAVRGGGSAREAMNPADGADLGSAPATLAWGIQPGAIRYRVRLYDETAELLWESAPGEVPRVALPSQVRSRLATGGAFFWTVELEGRTVRRRLGPTWFEVRPPRE